MSEPADPLDLDAIERTAGNPYLRVCDEDVLAVCAALRAAREQLAAEHMHFLNAEARIAELQAQLDEHAKNKGVGSAR